MIKTSSKKKLNDLSINLSTPLTYILFFKVILTVVLVLERFSKRESIPSYRLCSAINELIKLKKL